MPVVRYNACEIAWHIREQPIVAARRVVPDTAIMPICPADTYRHCRGTSTALPVSWLGSPAPLKTVLGGAVMATVTMKYSYRPWPSFVKVIETP